MSGLSSSSSTPGPSNPGSSTSEANGEKNSVVIKVGMVGDSQIGKTSLMVKYVEGSFDEDYIQTLGRQANTRRPTPPSLLLKLNTFSL